jgi:hypothetical protein
MSYDCKSKMGGREAPEGRLTVDWECIMGASVSIEAGMDQAAKTL